jgi:hypothetical protein
MTAQDSSHMSVRTTSGSGSKEPSVGVGALYAAPGVGALPACSGEAMLILGLGVETGVDEK